MSSDDFCFQLNKRICQAQSVKELDNIVYKNVYKMNEVNLSTTINRCAKLVRNEKDDLIAKELISIFVPLIISKVKTFKAQDISNILWAFAKLGIKQEEIFNVFVPQIIAKVKTFKAQEIANILWAFAKLGIKCEEIFNVFVPQIILKAITFNSQNISNILWAFAKSKIINEEMFVKLLYCTDNLKFNDIELSQISDFVTFMQENDIYLEIPNKTFEAVISYRLRKFKNNEKISEDSEAASSY